MNDDINFRLHCTMHSSLQKSTCSMKLSYSSGKKLQNEKQINTCDSFLFPVLKSHKFLIGQSLCVDYLLTL